MKLYVLLICVWISPQLYESGINVNVGVKVPGIKVRLPQIKLPKIKITTTIKHTNRKKKPWVLRLPGFAIDTGIEKNHWWKDKWDKWDDDKWEDDKWEDDKWGEASPESWPEPEDIDSWEVPEPWPKGHDDSWAEPEDSWNDGWGSSERESIDKWQAARKKHRHPPKHMEDILNNDKENGKKESTPSSPHHWPYYPTSYYPPWPMFPGWPSPYGYPSPPTNTSKSSSSQEEEKN